MKKSTQKAAAPDVATEASTTKAITAEPESAPTVASLRILKIARCPTVSGKSTLTYHVGCTPESAIKIRLYANSGNGFLNQDWIPWTAILERIEPKSGETAFTSQVLHALFSGKSLNSPAFLMAVLKAEGVVKVSTVKRRYYEWVKDHGFQEEVERLMASSVDLDADEKARPAAKRAPKPAGTSKPKKQAPEPAPTEQGTADADTDA